MVVTLATRTFDATGEIQETSAHHFNHDKLFRDLGQPPRDRAERVTYNRKRGIRTAGTSECHGERDGRARDRSTLGPDAADSRFEVDELAATGASFLGEAAVDGVAVPAAIPTSLYKKKIIASSDSDEAVHGLPRRASRTCC
jgi:hypothetical protein